MKNSPMQVPLEDELGDVLDKALSRAGLSPDQAAARSGVEVSRLRDALDWRSELDCRELGSLAALLGLNEVGLCALASGSYPLPEIAGLPFCLHPLRMPHGIGVANAYIVSECCGSGGILFDTGPGLEALLAGWPARIQKLDAVFLTHVEPEHAGGLCEVTRHFRAENAFSPAPTGSPCHRGMEDSQSWENGRFRVTALSTPGHAAAHNCYLVESAGARRGRSLLISGDLLFAGSVGCPLHCAERLNASLGRLLSSLPEDTVIAPGHGPLTTLANERRYNPFLR
jgi:glyoxylase-like metal-dependent hydrolase (beta-lactamase superfamily II)